MSRKYTPRRFGARWSAEAPAYVLDVLDNKGKTADRYTVLFTGPLLITDGTYAGTHVPYLGMSGAPTHPQGFSQWGEMSAYNASTYRYASGKDRIRWLDLPEHIRAHVIARAKPD